ncbi:CpaF family protein [Candidatus Woesearchaeota archaeon]|nr:CpaF family protein [Candidatus Woesearchaeota archaeon]
MPDKAMDMYTLNVEGIQVQVQVVQGKEDFVPSYVLSILNVSDTTKIILEKIREKFVSEVQMGQVELAGLERFEELKAKFAGEVEKLLNQYLPKIDPQTKTVLINYVIQQNLGLGYIEVLLKDDSLEEIVVNGTKDPVWVYHKKHGWLKSNVFLESEDQIRHYSTMIGKDVGKAITILSPLLDAHLVTGDRVNATLHPISNFGNTITIRKFSRKPWTITDLIKYKTINYEGAALVWLAMQQEMSILIAGGTGSGKTSFLNVLCNFLPPNQRILSIEDTRELQLPPTLHWVPMETRMANPEGKGEVSMLDLVVNSLRMRPDRILVGEIRRKREAEVLFEAMHTGHSVYATVHANNARETIVRLTNPPIEIPKLMLPALGLIVVQHRDRRTGKRRTLQVAEVTEDGEPNVLLQLNARTDQLEKINESKTLVNNLMLYTGMTQDDIRKDIEEKIGILQALVRKDVTDLHQIGLILARYYTQGTTFR